MQILIQLPNGKTKLDPLTVDSDEYVLYNGQRIHDSKNSTALSKSHMVHLELKKLENKILGFLNIFKKASKRNQSIVYPLIDQYWTVSNLFSTLYNEADDKNRFRIPKSFYDEVRKLDILLTKNKKHIKHKPKTKFDIALKEYFMMLSFMQRSIAEVKHCPVPRCDKEGYVMEPLSTTNRDFKKKRAVKKFLDSYSRKHKKLPSYLEVIKHLDQVLEKRWGVFKGEKLIKPIRGFLTESKAEKHLDKINRTNQTNQCSKVNVYRVDIIDSIKPRTYYEYKKEYEKGTIEWFFSTHDLVIVKDNP